MTAFAEGRDAIELLKYFHKRLDAHYRALHEQRQELEPHAPVFAIEHDLDTAEFEMLQAAVQVAVARGFGVQNRAWWLPFVAYAADVGYDYVGVDYWPPFAERTPGWETLPGWNVSGNRRRIRTWFEQFADEYGGARPTGAWAAHFKNIAWPITHAVMPAYLQRQLAQLLYDFRASLSTDLLNDPDTLGAKLAARTGAYTARFRIFCSQHSLLGLVAVALLGGDDESPYLVRSTLRRIVEGLTSERQARRWLQRARQSAVRVRTTGFRPSSSRGPGSAGSRLPALSDPRLILKRLEDGWQLFADLPDLTPLGARLPHLYDELRKLRAKIAGVDRPVAQGRLLFPGEQRLGALPAQGQPFIQLERGSDAVNDLIADQCRVTPGPWWVFRRRTSAHAIEVKGKFIRPGHTYFLLGQPDASPPEVPWIQDLLLRLTDAHGFELTAPEQISDEHAAVLTRAGISILSGVAIRPVGLVPLAWDGEGAVEYLAGESVMLALRSERVPEKCVVIVDGGPPELIPWPAGKSQLYFAVDHLAVGVHDVAATLLSGGVDTPVASGSVLVTIREPRFESGTSAAGEGIRLLASPARPSLTDLWDRHAAIAIDGPPGTQAQLTVALKAVSGTEMARLRRTIELPLTEDEWRDFARRELRGSDLGNAYDEAESCEITVSRSGIGFATLACEREFSPLRWLLSKLHSGGYEARLIDRTDGAATVVQLFEVSAPLVPVHKPADAPVASPAQGGLLCAISGELSAAIILPPDPNQLWQQRGARRPYVQVGNKSTTEAMRLIRGHHAWSSADLPADPFAQRQQWRALEAITSELAGLIGGHRLAHQERLQRGRDLLDHLETMRVLVGELPEQQMIAQQIAMSFHRWADQPAVPVVELANLIAPLVASSGMGHTLDATRFLVRLCSAPGRLIDWEEEERDRFLECTLRAPVLVRTVRFAVLGREAFRDSTEEERGRGGST